MKQQKKYDYKGFRIGIRSQKLIDKLKEINAKQREKNPDLSLTDTLKEMLWAGINANKSN